LAGREPLLQQPDRQDKSLHSIGLANAVAA